MLPIGCGMTDREGVSSLSTGVQTCMARCISARAVESGSLVGESLLSVHDVAAYLNVPVRWVYQRVQRKDIPHRRLGKHLRFEVHELEQWLSHL